MPPHLPFNFRTLPPIYYALYWFAVSTFAAATATTLPCLDAEIATALFSLLMQISSGLMGMVEAMELVVEPVPRWSTPICLINLAGLSCYFYSSLRYEELNKGELYLLGAFCFSLGYELKVLAIVIQEGRSMATIIRQEKYRFARLGCMIVGTLLFLGGSVMVQLNNEQSWGSGALNLSGGLITATSAFLLFKKP
jgi:hypothetical protein